MNTPQEALKRIIEHREIFHDEMISLMRQIMSGEVSPVHDRGHHRGLARQERNHRRDRRRRAGDARDFRPCGMPTTRATLVDTCGTGGDGAHSFNISTTAAFRRRGSGGA